MLKERIAYKDGLPVNLVVAEIEDYPLHFHDELEVVYVLEGSIRLRDGYYNYTLKRGDVFILNDREIHSMERADSKKNIVMMLHLDLTYFSAYYSHLKNNFFVTDMEEEEDESLEVLRNILARMMREILQKGRRYEQQVIESAHNLITCLLSDFQYFLLEDGKFVNETKKKGNKVLAGRLNRITDYMYDHYDRKLTLREIAEREHLSIYYLSHVIKESTGLSFQDLLSFIRVEESEKLLLGTKKKIGAIAAETGFSAIRYYIKHFERWYGMHPQEYRKKYTGKIISRESKAKMRRCSPEEIEEAVRAQVDGVFVEHHLMRKIRPVIVDVNISENAGAEPATGMLDQLMNNSVLRPVMGPYATIRGLGETVVASGENYLVTAAPEKSGGNPSLSMLVYNYDRVLGHSLERADRLHTVLELIKNYDTGMEFLFRCTGLSGNYRICRYKRSKENHIMIYRRMLRTGAERTARKSLIHQWSSIPSVEFGSTAATETLSIRTTMNGFSAELILLDPVEEKEVER